MKKYLYVIVLFLLCPTIIFAQNKKMEVTLSKCVDGDTAKFILNKKEITVRFLAIDTPETKHPNKKEEPFGLEASDYTCKTLKSANTIVIEYDKNSKKQDKYDRHLAWVYVDDVLLQESLVKKGLAKVAYLYGNYAYTEQLQKEEKIAQTQQLGIWSNEVPKKESNWYFILIIVLIIIIYLIYPKGRKKINHKIKSQVKKEIRKRIP